MQNNTNNTEQRDKFSELVGQKLENHQLPVDDACWNDINAQMNKSSRKIIPFWYWLSGSTAVAVLALLFVLRPFSEMHESIAVSTETKTEIAENDFIEKNEPTETKAFAQNNKVKPSRSYAKATTSTTSNIAENLNENSLENGLDISMETEVETKNIEKAPENTIFESENTELQTVVPNEKKAIIESLTENNIDDWVDDLKKDKKTWLVAASLGSGGSAPTNYSSPSFEYMSEGLARVRTMYTNILTPNDFSQKTYFSPLSVGLSLRKELTKTIGIESGLTYTYLHTSFRNAGVQTNDAGLSLHYLGIPLNVVAQFWQNPQWEVYGSAGGMIEKGLRSIYVQNEYVGTQTITTDASTNIDGFQWSTHVSVGIAYKIQRQLGVYFEPRFSYFFDNDQPVSIRTDNPVVIGFAAGLRYSL